MIFFTGAGWYLEKVIVKEGDEPGARMFYFPCDRWLDQGQDDGLIERVLEAAEPPKQSSESDARTNYSTQNDKDNTLIPTLFMSEKI